MDILSKKNNNLIVFVLLFTFFIFNASFYMVFEGKQAIVLQFGKPVGTTVTPGLHFKLPFIQTVIYSESRVLNIDTDPKEIITIDQKRLIVDSYAKYRITDPLMFYQSAGSVGAFLSRITPVLESNLREQIGKVSLLCLLAECRTEVMNAVHHYSNEKAKGFGVEIIDVRISKTDLPESNSEAIFARMNADRSMLAKQFRAQGQEEYNRITANANKERDRIVSGAQKKAEIITGEGMYESLLIYANAYKVDEDFFDFIRHINFYSLIFNKKNTKIIISGKEDMMKGLTSFDHLLNINKKTK